MRHCLFFGATTVNKEKMDFSVTLFFDNFVSQEIDVTFIREVIVSGSTSLCTIFRLIVSRSSSRMSSSHVASNQSLWFTTEKRTDEEIQLRIA